MVSRVNKFGLKVDTKLSDFIDNEVLNELQIDNDYFWKNFNDYITKFSIKNKEILETRKSIKQKLDEWHKKIKIILFMKNIRTFRRNWIFETEGLHLA